MTYSKRLLSLSLSLSLSNTYTHTHFISHKILPNTQESYILKHPKKQKTEDMGGEKPHSGVYFCFSLLIILLAAWSLHVLSFSHTYILSLSLQLLLSLWKELSFECAKKNCVSPKSKQKSVSDLATQKIEDLK